MVSCGKGDKGDTGLKDEKNDDCRKVMDKLKPLIVKEGSKFTAEDEAGGLAECRARLAKNGGKPDETMKCMLASTGEENEMAACISGQLRAK